jgi:hypothetical protein
MTTSHHPTVATLGWQHWAILFVVLALILAGTLILPGW